MTSSVNEARMRSPFLIQPGSKGGDTPEQVEAIATEATRCVENGDWGGYLTCIEGDLMPAWFARDSHRLPDGEYWSALRYVYNTVKPARRWLHVFHSLLRSERPERHEFMAPKELDVLARLPKTFSIYRGSFLGEVDSRLGEFSWTIDEEQAASDAVTLFGRDDICVITGMVRKAHVWAYGWGGEVMVPPEKVFKTSTRLIDAKSIDCERDKYFCFDIEGWLKEANRGS